MSAGGIRHGLAIAVMPSGTRRDWRAGEPAGLDYPILHSLAVFRIEIIAKRPSRPAT